MKKVLLLAAILAWVSCGVDPWQAVQAEVKSFMDQVQSGQLDAAVAMVQNKMDSAVPEKIRLFFTENSAAEYQILPADPDPKAKTALDMGMATVDVSLQLSDSAKTVRFLMGKNDQGKWVIKNIITELP